MSLHLHIDRLVLEGTSLTLRDATHLQTALGEELTALLRERALHPALAQGLAVPALAGSAVPLPTHVHPSNFGRQIAQNVAESLAPKARP